MLIPKQNRLKVYEYLFTEGVLVAKKNLFANKHHELDVPNLQVIKMMLSLVSRGYVKEQFNWGWHYFFLTNEGIEYLRGYLNLPEEVVPNTLKKGRTPSRPSAPTGGKPSFGSGTPGTEKKLGAPGADFKPGYQGQEGSPSRGGFGRGSRGRGEYRRGDSFSRGRGGSGRGGNE